jgi:nucleoside phosphorylase
VVASKVYDLHSGKAADTFQARPVALEPNYRLLQLAESVRRTDQWPERVLGASRAAGGTVYLGPIGASQQVVTDPASALWTTIRDHFGDTLAVDMESAGFMRAIHASNDIPALVVRGILAPISRPRLTRTGNPLRLRARLRSR